MENHNSSPFRVSNIAPATAPFDYIRADLLNASRALTEEERVRENMRATIADLRTRLDDTTKAHKNALDEAARATVEMNRALEAEAMTRNRLERMIADAADRASDIDAATLTYEDGFCAGYDQGNIDTLRELAEAGSDRHHRAFVGLWTLGIIGATLALPLAAFLAH